MKNILIIAWIMLSSSLLFAQKTKTVDVVKRVSQQEYVYVVYAFGSNNNIIDTTMMFHCQNSNYQHITNTISLFRGSAKQFYIYLLALEDFVNKNISDVTDGVSINGDVNGQRVRMYKISYVIGVDVYAKDGYHSFLPKWIGKIKSQYIAWCKKNNVVYE
ncbi:MAG: hypothetical protein RR137_08950 [Odoribacter sp.]